MRYGSALGRGEGELWSGVANSNAQSCSPVPCGLEVRISFACEATHADGIARMTGVKLAEAGVPVRIMQTRFTCALSDRSTYWAT